MGLFRWCSLSSRSNMGRGPKKHMKRLLKVDGKVRTDANFPAGFMDVITIEKTDEKFRLLFDTKGRFTVHRLKDAAETKFKLCKITKLYVGQKGIPFAVTHD